MAEQLDLFDNDKDWDEALTDYCAENIKQYLDTPAFYAIYEDPFTTKLNYVGPYDIEGEAATAMDEFDGEMVLKATYKEMEMFIKHNNKTVTQ